MAGAEKDLAQDAPFAGAMPVELLRLRPSEQGVLAMLRHLMVAADQPQPTAWEAALTLANARWPAAAGAVVLAGQAFVRALRAARPAGFRYADPLDLDQRAFLSPEEAAMMRMLRAMRQDITPEARAQMALLTGGRVEAALVKAGLILCRALPAPETGGVVSTPHKGLRLVH